MLQFSEVTHVCRILKGSLSYKEESFEIDFFVIIINQNNPKIFVNLSKRVIFILF